MSVNVVIINATNGYPRKFSAGNTKVEFIAKGLIENGALVTVINLPDGEIDLSELQDMTDGNIRHISFPQKHGRLFSIFYNTIALISILRRLKQKGMKNFVINDFSYFTTFLYHVFIANIFGYKIVPLYHEWHYSFKHKGIKRLSNILTDKYFGRFASGILPISQFLEDQSIGFKKPMLKLPILADFQSIKEDTNILERNYFLYCGHSRYFRLIRIIVEGYQLFLRGGGVQRLVLVMGGEKNDVDKVREFIAEQCLQDKVEIIIQVPYDDLIAMYQRALALLIPLDPNNLQDKARFSQKIAEYLSVKRPIICVNVGEVSHYFVDKQNAFIAEDFTPDEFSKQMQFVASNPHLADEVGRNGYEMGKNEFDFRPNGNKLYEFLQSL